MPTKAINKVIYGNNVLLDLTEDTVTEDKVLYGYTAHDKSGSQITGTIAEKSSTDLTVSGATVTAPAGYYGSNASKSVNTTTHPNPTVSVNSSGLMTASHTQSTGYVTGGTTTGTSQLTTQAAKTVTPTKSSQTAVASGRYTTGVITVAAIPSNYIDTTDATATASDIISSKTAYVNGSKLTGTLTFQTIYSGSSTPSSSLGVNGDVYIQV